MKTKLASNFWWSATVTSLFAASCYPDFAGLTSETGRGGSHTNGGAGGGGGGIPGGGGSSEFGGEPTSGTAGKTSKGGGGNVAGTAGTSTDLAGAGGGGGEGGERSLATCDPTPVTLGDPAIIQYQLDDASGTVAAAAAASGPDATLTGTAWDTKGHDGGALKLSGEGQRMTIPAGVLETLDEVTIMAWVKPSYESAASTLFDLGTAADRFALEIGTTLNLVVKAGTLDQAFPGTIALPTNRWNHVALTLGNGKAAAYVDGHPMVRGNIDLKPSDLTAAAEIWIGQSHGTGTNTYGLVDQVEIFDRVIDEREMLARELDGADYIYFPFDEICPGAVAAEVPAGLTAQLPNGATLADGRLGKAIQLNSLSMQYVALPPGIVQDCTDDFTYAGWVYLTTNNVWGRLFDFGLDKTTYFFLSPNAQNPAGVHFGATIGGGNGGEQMLLAPATVVSVGQWHHFAVTIKGATGTLYYDGAPLATSDQIVVNPSDMGTTTNNWFGRSQYMEDSYLNGRLDEVVISCRAFTADEVHLLANIAAPMP